MKMNKKISKAKKIIEDWLAQGKPLEHPDLSEMLFDVLGWDNTKLVIELVKQYE